MVLGTRTVVSLVIALLVVLSGCSSAAPEPSTTTLGATAPVDTAPASGMEEPELDSIPPTNDPAGPSTTSAGEFVPDYSALVAAVELGMEGTAYEGAALEDPEVFIATAELFCDLLDEGMTPDELLSEYLVRLSDGGAEEVSEDDGLMAGVLLGASIEIVCAEETSNGP